MSIGERLKEERERLGFTQPAFAGLAETTKKSQIDYEKNLTQPKAGYLAVIARVGADVQYIVTGERSAAALAADETVLLEGFRGLDAATRKRMLAFVLGSPPPDETTPARAAAKRKKQKVEGSLQVFKQAPTGDIAGRDIVKKK